MKTIILFLFLFMGAYSQSSCNLRMLEKYSIYLVDFNDIKCMAENSSKKNTLFFTFGVWCEPCRLHLPNAIKFAKENDIDFYVLLVEAEENIKTKEAFEYLKLLYNNVNIAILKDEKYGFKRNKKNKKFISEITPKEFIDEDDYSKYILLNKSGKVKMITNWRDNNGNDWRDDSKMLIKCLLPVLNIDE